MKWGSSYVRLANEKAEVGGVKRGLPFALAAVCVFVLLAVATASSDYYQCYQAGHCSPPALSNASDCLEGRDYDVTITNPGSGVTVVSFHGGLIEPKHERDLTRVGAPVRLEPLRFQCARHVSMPRSE